jgi:hypothetical protein
MTQSGFLTDFAAKFLPFTIYVEWGVRIHVYDLYIAALRGHHAPNISPQCAHEIAAGGCIFAKTHLSQSLTRGFQRVNAT